MSTPTLTIFSQPDAARAFLLPYIRRAYPGVARIGHLTIDPLGSVQVGRGVYRILVTTVGRRTQRRELFASYDAKGGSETIYRFLLHLDRHGFSHGLLRAPRPLGYSQTQRVLVYESFPGRRLRDLVERHTLSAGRLGQYLIQSSAWLRRFHALPVNIGPRRTQTLSMASYSRLSAHQRAMLRSVIPLVNRVLRDDSGRPALVHGDPHLANCIVGRGRSFAFIDYSESYVGNPLADIGMFLVHLDVALKPYYPRQTVRQLQSVLISKYFGRVLAPETRRTLVAFQVRSAIQFLGFTADHHRRPTGYPAWILRRLEQIIVSGAQELDGACSELILAA